MTNLTPPVDYKNLRVLIDADQLDRALLFLHKYEALYHDDAELCALLGEAYHKINDLSEAERYYRKAIRLHPKHIQSYTLLESTMREQGRFEECRILLEKIKEIDPHLKGAATTSGSMIKLAEGNFLEGFKDYENRYSYKHMGDAYNKELFPRWKGKEPLAGRNILLRYEQGLGDSLQFVRYADYLKQKGATKVGVLCKDILHRLFLQMPSVDEVHSINPTSGYNFEAMMMSMPAILKTEKDSDIPAAPYLSVKEEDAKNWLTKMNPSGKLRVGIVWSGELKMALNWQAKRMNLRRSIPLKLWRPILDVDCDFYSLQKGDMEKDLVDFSAAHPIKNIMGGATDFYDTACIIANLDLVITVDTSVAHLAGAMGKPTWVYHRVDGDWRWMFNRSDSPWYPSVKIFRQEKFEEWRPVVNRVADKLRGVASSFIQEEVRRAYMREPSEIPQNEKDYYRNLIKVPENEKILNISRTNFSEIKNGDLVALLNTLEHLRKREKNRDIKFFIHPSALHQAGYCKQFFEFLKAETDYLSPTKGGTELDLKMRSVWNYRIALGDTLRLSVKRDKKKKVCIFPVFDAVTNPSRNWSPELTQQIIDRYSSEEFEDYTKIVCGVSAPNSLQLRGCSISRGFIANVEHILSCEIYVGGDTGLTHFASVLENGPKCVYHLPKGSARNTYPMYFEQGELNFYEGVTNGLRNI